MNVTIKRVYNNNVLLATQADGTDIVLLGKGIGFQRRAGELVDAAGCERFVAERTKKATQIAELLSDASLEQAQTARLIVATGVEVLGIRVSQSLLLTVLDHLSFAVKRAQEGVRIDMPLRWEVNQLFAQESAVGRQALTIVRERLHVELQDDEWVAFALHFVSHRWSGGDMGRTLTMTSTISQVFELLDRQWATTIDQDCPSAARFVTHLRYLFARALADQQLARTNISVMGAVQERYPEAARTALRVGDLIGSALKRKLSFEEVSYLALHTARLYAEVQPRSS